MSISVKQARTRREYSQKEIAEKLKIHRQTYIIWEKTPDKMSVGKAKEFCSIVNLSMNEIDW